MISDRALIRAFGLLSVGMCISLLDAPRAARSLGLGDRPNVLRAIVARDFVIGAGLLADPDPAPWLRAQAAADLIDAALLAHGLRAGIGDRRRATAWLLFATGAAFGALWLARRTEDAARR